MSFLRFFSPSRNASSLPVESFRPLIRSDKISRANFDALPQFARSSSGITLHLQIPSFGVTFLPPPSLDLDLDPSQPREDAILNGSLQIFVPPGIGNKRLKAVRVMLRGEITLNMGRERVRERNVLLERNVELLDQGEERLVLREGIQRFDFTIIIPHNLAPHDAHPNGRIAYSLSAEIEGQSGLAPNDDLTQTHTTSTDLSYTAGKGASPHPASNRQPLENVHKAVPAIRSISHEASALSELPAHDSHGGWLEETIRVYRDVRLIYNPNPLGGVTVLDEQISGFAPGLSAFKINWFSDVWTKSAVLLTRVTLPDLIPKVTIFHVRTSLIQTHTIRSPRDDPSVLPIVSSRKFTAVEFGKRPPLEHQHPGKEIPALWRGIEAGGKDVGEFNEEKVGRLTVDPLARPSTLPEVKTYIHVSHTLSTEVFFSVQGETNHGLPMAKPYAGGLRMMKIERPVILPSCNSPLLDLPSYETSPPWTPLQGPCPLCGTLRNEPYCTECVHIVIPHLRHDHDPKLVGDPRGICPACEAAVIQVGTYRRDDLDCACNDTLEEMEVRMRKALRLMGEDRRKAEGADAAKQEAEQRRRQS